MKGLFCSLLCFISLNLTAQISLPKTSGQKDAGISLDKFIAPPALGDIAKTTTGISESLITQLALPSAKKPELESAVSSFLTDKNKIMGLSKSNPTDYLTKFNPLQKGLFGKLKTIMGVAAFSKFMGLKPSAKNMAANPLSNLFF